MLHQWNCKVRSEDGKRDLCDDRLKCIKREVQLRERAPKHNHPVVPLWSLKPWNKCWRQFGIPSFTILNVIDLFFDVYRRDGRIPCHEYRKNWISRNRVVSCHASALLLSRSIWINRSEYRVQWWIELSRREGLAKCIDAGWVSRRVLCNVLIFSLKLNIYESP